MLESLTLLEAGNALDPVVVRAMQRAGWSVKRADRDEPGSISFDVSPLLTVTGQPVAIGSITLFGDELRIEVKTRGLEAFKRGQTVGVERSHPDSDAQDAEEGGLWQRSRAQRDVGVSVRARWQCGRGASAGLILSDSVASAGDGVDGSRLEFGDADEIGRGGGAC